MALFKVHATTGIEIKPKPHRCYFIGRYCMPVKHMDTLEIVKQ